MIFFIFNILFELNLLFAEAGFLPVGTTNLLILEGLRINNM